MFLVCLACMQCGDSKKVHSVNYSDILSDCFNKEEIEHIEEGIYTFNAFVADANKIEAELTAADYRKYFDRISGFNLPREMFSDENSLKYLNNLEKTEFFKTLFIRRSEYEKTLEETEVDIPITPRSNQNKAKEEIPDFYVSNSQGELLTCLIQKAQNKELKNYLISLTQAAALSPSIKAYSLKEMSTKMESQTDQKILVAAATFDVFFPTVFLFNTFDE